MKKYLLLFVLIILSSCSNDDKNSNSVASLQGRWLWVSSTGGFQGVTPAALNRKEELEFSDNYVKTYIDGQLMKKLKFHIATKKSIFGGNKKLIVIDKEDITQVYYADRSFIIAGDKLTLSEECNDCFISKYEKVK
ncbi:hypothetical protein [Flavobacterium sp. ASV13]|uniref:hypothetical protein n=1 Tax=Flavobacterium sp. ASV13 TaxID=1506583 RepID=UPI0005526315|nr:hypothetical protein [Flavobacterium sp. ASV13]